MRHRPAHHRSRSRRDPDDQGHRRHHRDRFVRSYLATKLEAFRGRGTGDYGGSHDLEDLAAVIDGRKEIVEDVHSADAFVRTYVATEVRKLLKARAFVDALPGFLLPDASSQQRLPSLLARLKELSSLGRV